MEQDHTKVLSPSLNDKDRERDVIPDSEAATGIPDHLGRFEYASLQRALLTLLSRCGTRSGTVRSFGLREYDRKNQWLRAKHRPETPLMKMEKGERLIALSSGVCDVLNDSIDHNREDVGDEQGRKPLPTTQFWRVSKSIIREPCTGGRTPVCTTVATARTVGTPTPAKH